MILSRFFQPIQEELTECTRRFGEDDGLVLYEAYLLPRIFSVAKFSHDNVRLSVHDGCVVVAEIDRRIMTQQINNEGFIGSFG